MTKFTVPFFYKVEYKPSLRYKHTFFAKLKAECSGEIDDVSKSDLKLALEVRREYALQSLCGNRNYYDTKASSIHLYQLMYIQKKKVTIIQIFGLRSYLVK